MKTMSERAEFESTDRDYVSETKPEVCVED